MLKRFIIKLILFYKGIRFYKTECVPKYPEFKKAEFKTINDSSIVFYFYKEECEDLIFKRGRISNEKFVGYIIQAVFSEDIPPSVYKYNNLKFFFNINKLLVNDEDTIIECLLNIYLDFIKYELELENKKK